MSGRGPTWRRAGHGTDTRYGAVVADVPTGHDDPGEVEAYGGFLVGESIRAHNQPLVAAAPDLLEAARLALAFLEYLTDETGPDRPGDDLDAVAARDKLRHAVARAEDRAPSEPPARPGRAPHELMADATRTLAEIYRFATFEPVTDWSRARHASSSSRACLIRLGCEDQVRALEGRS